MREWIRLVRALHQRGGRVLLERVADVLMTQINMIQEFRDTVQIRSFHAQYVCPACGAEAAPLVDAVANAEALRELRPPRLPCPECGAEMELGDFPERSKPPWPRYVPRREARSPGSFRYVRPPP
jgi:predicted RNA-binding Zn-ribbon protein involved in translation (DUF1610 family)